jgi:hypothetical protein
MKLSQLLTRAEFIMSLKYILPALAASQMVFASRECSYP